jgi:hypothetical protein
MGPGSAIRGFFWLVYLGQIAAVIEHIDWRGAITLPVDDVTNGVTPVVAGGREGNIIGIPIRVRVPLDGLGCCTGIAQYWQSLAIQHVAD